MRSLQSSSRGVSARVIEFAALESRTLFCGYHAAAGGAIISQLPGVNAPGNGSTPSNNNPILHTGGLNVPVYNSLIGAKATIYLDFGGDAARTWGSYSVPATPAYDTDGNASSFSASELNSIAEIWQRIAEKFSPFSINVTTVNPGSFLNGKALQVVIGGNGSWIGSPGGISYVNSFTNSAPNTAYAFSMNLGAGFAKYVAEAISHESGHAFGLQHQSTFDSGGGKTAEYSSGNGVDAPTMGNSYGSTRGMWWYGPNTNNTMQDDMSILSGATNAFGYRADDFGSSPGTAKRTGWANSKFMIKGMIGSVDDRDYFRFAFDGGTLTLKLRSQGPGAMLDARLRIYKPDGTLVKHVDNADLSETIVRTLAPGTYYAAIFSHGDYGDVGQYTLYGYDDVLGAAPTPGPTPVLAPAPTAPATPTPNAVTSIAAAIFSSKEITGALGIEVESLVG